MRVIPSIDNSKFLIVLSNEDRPAMNSIESVLSDLVFNTRAEAASFVAKITERRSNAEIRRLVFGKTRTTAKE